MQGSINLWHVQSGQCSGLHHSVCEQFKLEFLEVQHEILEEATRIIREEGARLGASQPWQGLWHSPRLVNTPTQLVRGPLDGTSPL